MVNALVPMGQVRVYECLLVYHLIGQSCAGYELAKNAMKNRDSAAQAAASQEYSAVEEQIAAK